MTTALHTETLGPQGAPEVVCLHGGTGTGAYHWGAVGGTLAERWRLHLPDLPGHGRSPLPADGRYGRELLVAAVAHYLEGFASPVHVLAFSLGGQACLELAGRRPELFASLALIGVSIRDHERLRRWRRRFDPDELEAAYPLWAQRLSRIHEPLGGSEAWKEVCRRDAGGLTAEVDLTGLRQLSAPVLLVRGDRDPAVDPAHYGELRALWEHTAEEFVVPAGGHEVQMTRSPVVAPALDDFLQRSAS